MSTKFLKHFNTRQTPQSEPIPGSAQVPNSAGGYAFAGRRLGAARAVPDPRLRGRVVLRERAGADGREREGGRALPRGRRRAGDPHDRRRSATRAGRRRTSRRSWRWRSRRAWATRRAALRGAAEGLPHGHAPVRLRRGRAGPPRLGPRRCARASPPGTRARRPSDLAYQVAKYQQRNGWSHRDLLRLAHPASADAARAGGLPLGRRRRPRRSGRARSSGARRSRRTPRSPRTCRALLGAMDEARAADRAAESSG